MDVGKELIKVAKILISAYSEYNEMDDILEVYQSYDIKEKLKTYGFRWNSDKKAWYKSNWSKVKDNEKEIIESLISPKKKEIDTEIIKNEIFEVLKKSDGTFDISKRRCSYGDIDVSLGWKENISNNFVSVKGNTYPIKEKIYNAGGRWNSTWKEYRFNLENIDIKKFENLIGFLNKSIKKFEEREKEKKEKIEEEKKGGVIQIAIGSGYTRRGEFEVGEILDNTNRKISKENVDWYYVIKAWKKYIREDGLSFGVGDDSGYIYYAKIRPATEEESKDKILEKEEKKNKSEKMKEIKEIIEYIQKNGEEPTIDKLIKVEGKTYYFNENQIIYGGGSWLTIQPDKLWYIVNNGRDGDDWTRNNVETGGAGAIGKYILKSDKNFDEYVNKIETYL